MIQKFFNKLKHNKYVLGIMMIAINICSRYVSMDVSKNQQSYIIANVSRQVLIFSILFVALKDIYVSIILTASFYILTEHLFHEDSDYCIISKGNKNVSVNSKNVSNKDIDLMIDNLNKLKNNR